MEERCPHLVFTKGSHTPEVVCRLGFGISVSDKGVKGNERCQTIRGGSPKRDCTSVELPPQIPSNVLISTGR